MWNPFCGSWWGPGMFFGGPLGMLMMFVFWALIIYGIFYFISHVARPSAEIVRKEGTSIEILKRRYARGEIDAEEYARRKKDLES